MSYNKIASIVLTVAFFLLGLLIGTLLAFSAQSLSKGVMAALFALFGGSLLGLLQKLSITDQIKAAGGLGAIALGSMIGIYTGLYVNEYQLLTPLPQRVSNGHTSLIPPFNSPEKTDAEPANKSGSADTIKKPNLQGEAGKNPADSRGSVKPAGVKHAPSETLSDGGISPAKYLRANDLSTIDDIDQEYRNGLPAAEAYQRLRGVVLAKGELTLCCGCR